MGSRCVGLLVCMVVCRGTRPARQVTSSRTHAGSGGEEPKTSRSGAAYARFPFMVPVHTHPHTTARVYGVSASPSHVQETPQFVKALGTSDAQPSTAVELVYSLLRCLNPSHASHQILRSTVRDTRRTVGGCLVLFVLGDRDILVVEVLDSWADGGRKPLKWPQFPYLGRMAQARQEPAVRYVTWLFINFDGGFVAHNAREGGAYPGPAPPTKVVNFTTSSNNNNSTTGGGDTGTTTTTTTTSTANGGPGTAAGKTSDPLHDLPCYNEYLETWISDLSTMGDNRYGSHARLLGDVPLLSSRAMVNRYVNFL
ncbi:hypothetical protein RRG08_064849 [Elysia crispata]|uniref:Uncharacterized protein n=1 Tax=Elysia crispata TaxID=231223 RepID=A0AAE1A282_9GAST|nr:hypothetical protein RRG08_064849 [Elysia crispata]